MALERLVSLGRLSALPNGRPKLVVQKESGARFACIRRGDDVDVFDDRCPHEGHPLSMGLVREGVLTCQWHNWKFDVATGACTFGGEGVRKYVFCRAARALLAGGLANDAHATTFAVQAKGLIARLGGSHDDGARVEASDIARVAKDGVLGRNDDTLAGRLIAARALLEHAEEFPEMQAHVAAAMEVLFVREPPPSLARLAGNAARHVETGEPPIADPPEAGRVPPPEDMSG